MKKLLASLLVIAAFAVVSDANAWGCRKSCATGPACPVEVREAPRPDCFRTITQEIPACPTKFVDISYACPEDSQYRNGTIVRSEGPVSKRGKKSAAY